MVMGQFVKSNYKLGVGANPLPQVMMMLAKEKCQNSCYSHVDYHKLSWQGGLELIIL